jgi:hypothetical protein
MAGFCGVVMNSLVSEGFLDVMGTLLKWILNERGLSMWTGLFSLGINIDGWLLWSW